MENINNPYVLSLGIGILCITISYVESKINKIDRDRDSYIKLFILTTLSTLLLLMCQSSLPGQKGGNRLLKVNQDILVGNPNF